MKAVDNIALSMTVVNKLKISSSVKDDSVQFWRKLNYPTLLMFTNVANNATNN